jgi:hypothetical protein
MVVLLAMGGYGAGYLGWQVGGHLHQNMYLSVCCYTAQIPIQWLLPPPPADPYRF